MRVWKGFSGARETNTVLYDPAVVTVEGMVEALTRAGTYRGTAKRGRVRPAGFIPRAGRASPLLTIVHCDEDNSTRNEVLRLGDRDISGALDASAKTASRWWDAL
jgi:hypothetical protein